jgi:transcription elongation GreA/GreB family factor
MTKHLQLKSALLQKCSDHVNERMGTIQSALDSVYQSKLEETKSSAGDKFETGRAMMQAEEQKLKTQLHRAKQDLEVLAAVSKRSATDQVGPGNLVTTSQGEYLISIGIGKVVIDGDKYYCVSAQSPIGVVLCGRGLGDMVEFNGREFEISGIC